MSVQTYYDELDEFEDERSSILIQLRVETDQQRIEKLHRKLRCLNAREMAFRAEYSRMFAFA